MIVYMYTGRVKKNAPDQLQYRLNEIKATDHGKTVTLQTEIPMTLDKLRDFNRLIPTLFCPDDEAGWMMFGDETLSYDQFKTALVAYHRAKAETAEAQYRQAFNLIAGLTCDEKTGKVKRLENNTCGNDAILAEFVQGAKIELSGIYHPSTELFRIYRETMDKEAFCDTFFVLTGKTFTDYLDACIRDVNEMVGRIEYLGSNGKVGETVEYNDADSFISDVKKENHYGTPMRVVVYRGTNGHTIDYSSIAECDPPLCGFAIEDHNK